MSEKVRADEGAPQLETSRLCLRQWRLEDLAPFAEMNRDPEVMRYFPKSLTELESNAMVERVSQELVRDRHGFWAVEEKESRSFLGFLALARVQVECPGKGEIEIGWRLRRSSWGHGYASEGARQLLEYGFGEMNLAQIVSLTSKVNVRSQKVMERIGMVRNRADDFEYLRATPENPIRPHVLYRLTREQWLKGRVAESFS